MIRIASTPAPKSTPAWHELFVRMLPAIRQHARISFRHLAPDSREDCIEEAICNACCAVTRLAELNKLDLCYASPLARYAVAQVKDNRRVGCRLNIKDVLSPYCQRRKKITVEHLDKFDETEGCWLGAIVEDDRTPVPDQVAFRCDFPAWLDSLPRRDRRIAEAPSVGHRTSDVARRFNVSAGRVSQLRRELAASWQEFTDEADGNAAA